MIKIGKNMLKLLKECFNFTKRVCIKSTSINGINQEEQKRVKPQKDDVLPLIYKLVEKTKNMSDDITYQMNCYIKQYTKRILSRLENRLVCLEENLENLIDKERKEIIDILNELINKLDTLSNLMYSNISSRQEYKQGAGNVYSKIFPHTIIAILMREEESLKDFLETYNSYVNMKPTELLKKVGGVFFNPVNSKEIHIRTHGYPFILKKFETISIILPIPWDYLNPDEREIVKRYYEVEKGKEGSKFKVRVPAILLHHDSKMYFQGLLEISSDSPL